MPIQILTDKVVAQIAAGEVIERPASVIKELVENSLDAAATSIHISVSNGGRRKIQVSDNGDGIRAEEVGRAFARHATSKLVDVNDLARIRTLGFRGEALASIASVSRVTTKTRYHDEAVGTQLDLEGGQILQHKSIGTPAGTIIAVENLFYNTPARLKFLKAENTEKRHISMVVSRYAMAYPEVRFILEQDGREGFRTDGTGQLSDALIAALGLDAFREMIEIGSESATQSRIQVSGFTSHPNLNRADRSHITLFVNGRWIQDSSLSYAVIQAYHTFLMKGRFPVAVIMIELPPDEVDVNVHPTKAEVRFQNANEVFASVQRTIRRALIDFIQTPAFHDGRGLTASVQPYDSNQRTQMGLDLELDSPGWFPHQHSTALGENPTAIPFGPHAPAKPRTLPMLRVVGQVGASYIVAEGPAGFYLIDQHAAHERILYEQFMENQAHQEPMAQLTLSAQTIELPLAESHLIEEIYKRLQRLAFR